MAIAGACGTEVAAVASALARRLGVAVLDAQVPELVAARLELPVSVTTSLDGHADSKLTRMLAYTEVFGATPEVARCIEQCAIVERAREATEAVLRENAARGAVIVGRAGSFVLADIDFVMRVRIDGPVARRIDRLAERADLSQRDARRIVGRADRAEAAYVRRAYRRDVTDPSNYDVILDGTRLDVSTCATIAMNAALARRAN